MLPLSAWNKTWHYCADLIPSFFNWVVKLSCFFGLNISPHKSALDYVESPRWRTSKTLSSPATAGTCFLLSSPGNFPCLARMDSFESEEHRASHLSAKRARQNTADQEPSRPRKRNATACQVCRARKTKCDNKKPKCSYCQSIGAACDELRDELARCVSCKALIYLMGKRCWISRIQLSNSNHEESYKGTQLGQIKYIINYIEQTIEGI